jgi:type IV pilus assembly protein PilA
MKKNGFTLIELLIVIAIIAIMAAVIVPTVSRLKNGRKTNTTEYNVTHSKEVGPVNAVSTNLPPPVE